MFENIVITHIEKPLTVLSERGRTFRTDSRPSYGLSFCNSGQITYTQAGKQYVSTPHTAVLLPRGASYSLYGDKTGSFPLINFQCEGLVCEEITVIPLDNPRSYIHKVKKLSNYFLYTDKKLTAFSVFYDLLDTIETAQFASQNPLHTIIDYLRDDISNPELSNQMLAERMGISEVYLRKLFLAHCGMTPKQYILALRIDKAKQMLEDNTHTVTAIADRCGFSSLYHFSRCFKDRTGSTPSEYARSHTIRKI